MLATRRLVCWTLIAVWCALFGTKEASATLANPVMWILAHQSLKQARVDPIVTPGGVSSHVHSLVGANGVSADTTTAESLEAASTCTTAGLHADMSSYWAPSLYSINPDGTFTPRQLYYVNTYYLMRGNVEIKAFPRRTSTAGGQCNAQRTRTYEASRQYGIVCLPSTTPTAARNQRRFLHELVPQGLRLQVTFPSCWNGKDLVSADHSHVVYPLGDDADQGACPASHSVRLPTLFYEFVWDVTGITNTNNSELVLSNGDSMGYSFHADFISAWDETILQAAIDQCGGSLFNDLESCPPLAQTLDRQASRDCTATSTEAMSGTLASLPGCNMVWNGPHAGIGLTAGCDPTKVVMKPDGYMGSSNISSSSSLSSSSLSATSSTAPTTEATKNTAVAASMTKSKTRRVKQTPKATPAPKKKHKSTAINKKKHRRPTKVQRKKRPRKCS
ncbi:uncharacterized protein UMAG_10221 [Mycosarcoma maydis]|uniref:DUF1996 domain-containing protein n=1 Tax=Mycosarcoma maydis TaxID=5270 RepID=A0A0D1CHI6_MYCMD|nr:uncharacterized protein UMAG_10221 [Ustilago maydis 521]KIS66428.1 hypothetical protein UMAG_10221 [Ustilago maydis 521]|eukprot:XP_011392143.1 hypothetical protein UMAG_10221 [Ustilago maydis 521]